MVLLVFVLVNAAVCGGIASPYDRFQGRIVWLIPLAAVLAATATFWPRNTSNRIFEQSK